MKEHIMKSRIEIDKKVRKAFLMLALAAFICFTCCGVIGMTAYADASDFKIDAEMMPSGVSTYDVRVTVENTGKDWEGTVRLTIMGSYGSKTDCAYDTVISLPQGSTKQFVVRIPRASFDSSGRSRDGDVNVALINKNSKVAAETEFKKLLNEEADALTMGILSDNYSALTYLDMGGQEIYYNSDEYPIKLMELNQDNLSDSLEALTFLVIDRYNTGVLTDDEISAIEKWTDDGGVLIIGTGSYAEDTLSGFDYLGVECRAVYEKGVNVKKWNSVSDYVDWSKLNMANLMDSTGQYYMQNLSLAMTCTYSDGAVGILPYSLSELGRLNVYDFDDTMDQSVFAYCILDEVSVNAVSRFGSLNSGYDDDSAYMTRRMLTVLGNSSNNLNFGVLKFIVIVYVILVGPVFYLILRFLKKRDLYWAVVPVSALLGIILVFFAGRGFEVVSTKVYSVTVCNLSGGRNSRTYLHCYDANHREWDLRLAEGYEYAGPQTSYSIGDDGLYYYHIRKEGDRLFFGIKPDVGFEDAYFCAGGQAADRKAGGSIGCDLSHSLTVRGVTNDTDFDFTYFAVVENGYVRVYKSLKAGETCSLIDKEEVFVTNLSGYYYYDYMYEARKTVKKGEMDMISALGMGIASADSQLDGYGIAIVGVTTDWDKVVDDNCSEVSYGCLYEIQ